MGRRKRGVRTAGRRFAAFSRDARPVRRAAADRAVIDGLVRWVEDRYREDLAKRPSKHLYVRTLPGPVIEQVDRLRDSPLIASLIGARVPAGSVVAPMKHTDELYMSHYNKDRGGDQGLFDRHYDGNLRFLSSSVVVRALIYLQSDATYKVVFGDSRVEKAFGDLRVRPDGLSPRAALGRGATTTRPTASASCSSATTWSRRRNAALAGRAALAANTSVFYVVKAAMEYSKSPRTPPQRAVGLLCNLFRRLNNIHPLDPAGVDRRRRRRARLGDGWAIGRLLA